MTDSQLPSAPPIKPLFTGRFVVPEGYPRAAANAFARFQFTRPAVWVPIGILIVIVGLEVWWAAVHVGGTGSEWIVFPIVVLALLVVNMFIRSRALTRQLAVNARAGGVYETALTDSTITMVTPNASSSVRYEYYEALNEQGDFLLLKVRGSRIRSIVPRQLFSDEAFDFLRSKIQR